MGQGHAGKGKPSKLTFVSDDNMLMTTGFSSSGQRQFALWDSVSLSDPVVTGLIYSLRLLCLYLFKVLIIMVMLYV